jgi:hypothetical protein
MTPGTTFDPQNINHGLSKVQILVIIYPWTGFFLVIHKYCSPSRNVKVEILIDRDGSLIHKVTSFIRST